MHDIFISYFHQDRSHAEALAQALERVGLTVWWDRTIQPGQTFDRVIEDALNGAKVVMVLWSRGAVERRWVLNEAEEAAARNILVPVLIESDVRIPLAFKRIQAADLVGWDGSPEAPEFRQLVATLGERIGERLADLLPPEESEREVPPPPPAPPAPPRPAPPLFYRHAGLTALLLAVFAVNCLETIAEASFRSRYGLGVELGNRIANAFQQLEGNLSFELHDATNWLAVYGYSISYFFLLPVLGIGLVAALWRRETVHAYRVLCLSIALDYLISLAFFLFFPVPERWAFPDSGAVLLSDRWSSSLIAFLRPISGLDNSFPSTHVSFTVVIVLVGYLFRVRLRHTMMVLSTPIVLSTFVLGIHWIPDIVAGVAVGVLSVALARRFTPVDESQAGCERAQPALAST